MSRSSAAASDHAPTDDSSTADATASTEQPSWSEDKNPTRPIPVFRLEDEARRLDRAAIAAMRKDDDLTELANSDDEPTLDAPAPSSPEAIAAMSTPRPVRVTARPPALKSLVITRPAPTQTPRASVAPAAVLRQVATEPLAFPRSAPLLVMSISARAPASTPAAFVSPPSGSHRKITPEQARTARDLGNTEDRRRSEGTFTVRLRKRDVQTYLVAGIWALALSLFAVLMFMATSA